MLSDPHSDAVTYSSLVVDNSDALLSTASILFNVFKCGRFLSSVQDSITYENTQLYGERRANGEIVGFEVVLYRCCFRFS